MPELVNTSTSTNKNDIIQLTESSSIETTLVSISNKIPCAETAFYHVNLSSVVQQFKRWQTLLPRVKPYYAIKCQNDRKIVQLLGNLGTGFDCASRDEIKTVINSMKWKYNEIGQNIIYANPYKFKKDIRYAQNAGVEMVTFDSLSELVKLRSDWPNAKLVLRISPERQYNVTCVLGNKFGANSDDIPTLLQKAKDFSMDIVGISFHVGSGCKEMDAFPETVEFCAKTIQLIRQYGYDPYLVDIGGGFPGVSNAIDDYQKQSEFESMCQRLNYVLDTYFPAHMGYRIIAEPGRYFVMGAYTLVTQILGKRTVDLMSLNDSNDNLTDPNEFDNGSTDGEVSTVNSFIDLQSAAESNLSSDDYNKYESLKCHRYIVNDGLYGSFNCILFDHAKPYPIGYYDEQGTFHYIADISDRSLTTIYGPTCDGFDCILSQVHLPEMTTNDWIVWPDMGAYTSVASTNFNGIESCFYYYEMNSFDVDKMDLIDCNKNNQNQLNAKMTVNKDKSDNNNNNNNNNSSKIAVY